ncbi:vWA domain-containing protein [Pseudaminobacter sp. NGMCC 1.201702]|uniref:vWA domain-containing protein n=1 Tax=Pseudaminobacter sp. NGMCC 1.201702 TaxID=3391825 RepID=UPI0039EEF716
MMKSLRAVLAASALVSTATYADTADRSIIVLDASGSMWGQIDGKPKLEIARETLKTVLQTVPVDMELGLMAYGHRQKGACDDIELVVPPATGTSGSIASAVDGMNFLGKTPLSAAVKQAAESLKYTEDKATVVLITDGLETCNADPCAIGKELEQAGVDFTAHVVGFGLTAEEGRQVACLAENTGGKYIQASDAGALRDALVETVAAEPEPAPEPQPQPTPAAPEFNVVPTLKLAETSSPLPADAGQSWQVYKANGDGKRGDHLSTDYGDWKGKLEPGDYILVGKLGEAEVEQRLAIEAGKISEPSLVLNAGTVTIKPLPAAGEGAADSATVFFEYPGGSTTEYGLAKVVLPAGKQTVKVKIGSAEVSESFDLAPGQSIEKEIIAGVGRAIVNGFYATEMKIEAGGLDARIFKAAKKIDGSREQVTYGYGPDEKFDLPPGEYVAVVKLDQAVAEQPFTVKVGESVEVNAVLNAGILAISAPGAERIEVFSARKDIQGERKSFGYAYGDSHQTTLPVGDYVVVADRGDDGGNKEEPATVKAGERVELTIP